MVFSPQSFGFALLACSNYHWQQSFLQAEQVLLDQLDEDGGCRRKCFQALRQMKEDVWCPGKRPVVTSHHLQVSGHARIWVGPLRMPCRARPEPLTMAVCVCVHATNLEDPSVHSCHPKVTAHYRDV